ncbi:Hypothetical predicted protein [Pelobates cultripes]|uniref:exodeoxyribonuclease III n=1 Tax=Pelobates cultripes TaxID=61616 RepID=A0AAD1WJP8_PELCU|nr:Hypothetical predicted protein [Pelobates cultripes]
MDGRLLILVGLLNDIQVTIANLYAPNTNQYDFLRKALRRVNQLKKGQTLICGDFNCVLDPALDRTGNPGSHLRSTHLGENLLALIYSHGLHDTWRALYPASKDYTFYSKVHDQYSRIDMSLVDTKTLDTLDEVSIAPITWSDHTPLTSSFTTLHPVRGQWRLNKSLIDNAERAAEIRRSLVHYFVDNQYTDTTIVTMRLAHKAVTCGMLIQQSAKMRRQLSEKSVSLLKDLKQAEIQHKASATESRRQEV